MILYDVPTIIIVIAFIIVLIEAIVILSLIRRRRKLEKSLRNRDLLLREVHHRLKNNLNLIGNIIRLQALGEEDPEQRRKFNEIVSRITSIGTIHEHLRISEDYTRVSFPEYVQALLGALQSSFGPENIMTRIDMEKISLSPKHAVPLALILTELVTNAFKHGFPDASSGNVWIVMRRDGDFLVLEVSNDGRPLPEGFSIEGTSSLGIQIIRDLVRQMEGMVRPLSSDLTGFNVTIPFRETE